MDQVPLYLAVFSISLSLLFVLLFLSLFVAGIALTIFWVFMIIDCVKNEPSTGNDRVVWLLVLFFLHVIGAVIYYYVRKVPREKLEFPSRQLI